MELLSRCEQKLARWYDSLPHLPELSRQQLSSHCWWIVLVVDIIAGLGVAGALILALAFGLFTSVMAGIFGALVGGVVVLVAVLRIGVSIATVVLAALAVRPLRRLQKKGWTLLFIVLLVWLASSVLEFLVHFNLFDLVRSVLFDAVYGYFLFEIREYFGSERINEFSETSQPLESSH